MTDMDIKFSALFWISMKLIYVQENKNVKRLMNARDGTCHVKTEVLTICLNFFFNFERSASVNLSLACLVDESKLNELL